MRRKERIWKIMKFFKNNKKAFNEINNIKKGNYHKVFLDNYEELFYKFLNYPDYRFSQLLINEGIVPDNGNWNREESQWVVEKGYMKPEEILLWGVRGKSEEVDEIYKKWYESKPVFEAPISVVETWLYPSLQTMSDLDVYAWRYSKWLDSQPKPTYKFICDLETEHISAILSTQTQLSSYYIEIFNGVLKQRNNEQKTI